MRPPSTQLLRCMRSALRQYHVSYPTPTPAISQSYRQIPSRHLSTSPIVFRQDDHPRKQPSPPPQSRRSRGSDSTIVPKPKTQDPRAQPSSESKEGEEEEPSKPPTDLGSLDVLGDTAGPSTAIDMCLPEGFNLNNGLQIRGGNGCLLVDGEVFLWRPWEAGGEGQETMVNKKGQWDIGKEALGVLNVVWPKPDLLILGLGPTVRPISPETRRHINELGMRIEVLDTRNAAGQFNLLATERGVREVAAAMIPLERER